MMHRVTLPSSLSVAFFFLVPAAGIAQGHMLFGDLTIKAPSGEELPATFEITLYNLAGRVLARQQVAPNGRYRFLGIRNGEYDLVIAAGGHQVKIHLFLTEVRDTDVRRDIELEWKADSEAETGPPPGGALSAADIYSRTRDKQEQLDKALDASAKRDYAQSRLLLRKLVTDDPKDFEAWTELGSVLFMEQEFSEAEDAYRRALEQNGNYSLALLNVGKLCLAQKRPDEAVDALIRAVTLRPQSAEANYLLGEAYLQVKKGSKAVGYLNEAIRLDPVGKADAHLRLAALYDAAKMKDLAAAEFEKFLQKKPEFPRRKELEQYIANNRKR